MGRSLDILLRMVAAEPDVFGRQIGFSERQLKQKGMGLANAIITGSEYTHKTIMGQQAIQPPFQGVPGPTDC